MAPMRLKQSAQPQISQSHPMSVMDLRCGGDHPLTGETRSELFEQQPIADPALGEVAVAVAEVRHEVCDTTA